MEKSTIFKNGKNQSISIRAIDTYHGKLLVTPLIPGMSRLRFIELDDGKILTGNPVIFDGKNPWVSG